MHLLTYLLFYHRRTNRGRGSGPLDNSTAIGADGLWSGHKKKKDILYTCTDTHNYEAYLQLKT